MRVQTREGAELTIEAGQFYEIPAGHEAWVEGDEPYINIEWQPSVAFGQAEGGDFDRIVATLLVTDIVNSTARCPRARRRRVARPAGAARRGGAEPARPIPWPRGDDDRRRVRGALRRRGASDPCGAGDQPRRVRDRSRGSRRRPHRRDRAGGRQRSRRRRPHRGADRGAGRPRRGLCVVGDARAACRLGRRLHRSRTPGAEGPLGAASRLPGRTRRPLAPSIQRRRSVDRPHRELVPGRASQERAFSVARSWDDRRPLRSARCSRCGNRGRACATRQSRPDNGTADCAASEGRTRVVPVLCVVSAHPSQLSTDRLSIHGGPIGSESSRCFQERDQVAVRG